MKSSIKIDFIDRGTGVGIEPVIRIELIKSEDPRDTLLAVLFESVSYQSFLELQHAPVQTNPEGNAVVGKTIYLFKPERDTGYMMSALKGCFYDWLREEGWNLSESPHVNSGGPFFYDKKKIRKPEDELLSDFISIKSLHKSQ